MNLDNVSTKIKMYKVDTKHLDGENFLLDLNN